VSEGEKRKQEKLVQLWQNIKVIAISEKTRSKGPIIVL